MQPASSFSEPASRSMIQTRVIKMCLNVTVMYKMANFKPYRFYLQHLSECHVHPGKKFCSLTGYLSFWGKTSVRKTKSIRSLRVLVAFNSVYSKWNHNLCIKDTFNFPLYWYCELVCCSLDMSQLFTCHEPPSAVLVVD